MPSSLHEYLAERVSQAASEPAIVVPYNRTPLQVLLLGYATLGLYYYYWLIRAARIAEDVLDRSERLSFWTLLIPVLNVRTVFRALATIEDRVRSASIRPPAPLWVFWLAHFLCACMWRLPGRYACLSLLAPIGIAAIHVYLTRAELADGLRPTNRLTMWEVGILVAGLPSVLLMVAGLEYVADSGAEALFVSGVGFVMLLSAALFLYLGYDGQKRFHG